MASPNQDPRRVARGTSRAVVCALAWLALFASSCRPPGSKDSGTHDHSGPHTQSPPAASQSAAPDRAKQRKVVELRNQPTERPPVSASSPSETLPSLPTLSWDETDEQVAPPAGSYAPGRPPRFDDRRLAQAGIRKLTGRYLVLYTDLPPSRAVDELPRVFDAAVPQFRRYFGIDAARLANWKIVGCVMADKQRFRAAGLLDPSLPEFENGYQLGWQLWVCDKPSDYYRRHLLLHEAVHAFMNHFLGAAGPPWYMEGMAEMLALHRWHDGNLTINILPPANREVWLWGRIKIIREAIRRGDWKSLQDVFAYGPTAHRDVAAYAYSWAACLFLSRHPHYRDAFGDLPKLVRRPADFVDAVAKSFSSNDGELSEDWQVFLQEVDYEFSFEGCVIRRRPVATLESGKATFQLDPQSGWQSTGIELEAGATYLVEARGEVRIRPGSPDWTTRPAGITIHYHRGRPLGMLLYAIGAREPAVGVRSPLLDPLALGDRIRIRPASDGVLFVRLNEPAGQLGDNDGSMQIDVGRSTGPTSDQPDHAR